MSSIRQKILCEGSEFVDGLAVGLNVGCVGE
jgi:hypothetical protein